MFVLRPSFVFIQIRSSESKYFSMRQITLLILSLAFLMLGCFQENKKIKDVDITAADILGNSEYLAFSYGGYRENTRAVVPTINELKDDMKILSATGIKLIRTYNTQQFGHTANLLQAIKQLKDEDPSFEMYVMLGTWIECEGAWSASANHNAGNVENNTAEREAAVKMAQTYPYIVKIIAVGNEAMVQWAINYFVYPNVILKWVDYLKELRKKGEIPTGIWITSSDNYESWGGGNPIYHTDELTELMGDLFSGVELSGHIRWVRSVHLGTILVYPERSRASSS